ncbi:unnamed protein product [Orchesella dallaii]|uniref:Lactate/malate dehydrogenase N-terminal domain-containing protein n=1 Tax=Orchesella dallaii TaxID=48710 RepID=A0ABP1S0D0_9HEXA
MDLQAVKSTVDADLKVTIVGVGQVGMACAYSILNQNIASEITLFHFILFTGEKLKGEMMDMQHGLLFCKPVKISAGTDFAITSGSKLVIITAGARQQEGQSRLDLCQQNTQILESLIPSLAKHSPNAVLLVVSNPVPIWSGVKVGGVRLLDIYPNFISENENLKESCKDLHREVVNSAYEIIKLKGYTNLAIGLSVANISRCILQNTGAIRPVSTLVKGLYGMENEVFLSLPCALGSQGVTDVMTLHLNSEEMRLLQKSCKTLESVQSTLQFSSS